MQNNPTRQYKPRGHLRCGLLATLLMTTALTWPGGPAHAQCVTTGTTANCTGDLSAGVTDGVDFNAPPVDTINVFDVTGNITPAAGFDGVFAETIGVGDSLTISVDTGPFGIITQGNIALGIFAGTVGDNSAVDVTNEGAISTPGDYSVGILAYAWGVSSDVEITNRGAISTEGYTARGIEASTGNLFIGPGNNSSVTLNNWGRIDTQGEASPGINTFTLGDNSIITIANHGVISTGSNGSTGISATTGDAFSVTGDYSSITLTNHGAITTEGDGSLGIFTQSVGKDADINIDNRAAITTQNNDAGGIVAQTFGIDSEVTVINDGAITTGGVEARGIVVSTGEPFSGGGDNSSITLTNRGKIETTGVDSDGILAVSIGRNASITLNNMGIITTQRDNARGISAATFGVGSAVNITNGAEIRIGGDDAAGAGANDAAGIFASSSTGDIDVVSTANISTKGDRSSAIEASSGNPGLGSGSVSVTSRGNLTTNGSRAHGIFARSSFGDKGDEAVAVSSTGDITADGELSWGILAQTTNNNVTVISEGDITATQAGIFTEVSSNNLGLIGNIKINSTGDIDVTGDSAFSGIQADSANGDVEITSSGNITIERNRGFGIRTFSAAGFSTTVDVMEGEITGGSGDGAGIALDGAAGTTNTLNVNGPVTLSALSGAAVLGGVGDTTINNWGILNTVTKGAIVLGAGANAFNNRFGGVFNAGGRVDLGTGNLFTNDGMLSPGGLGNIATTNVTGHFIQSDTGILAIDVRIGTPGADLADINGEADLSGLVVPTIVDPQVVRSGTLPQVTILTADRVTNNGIMAQDTAIIDYELLFPDAETVALGATVDFIPAGLNANQTAVAQTVNAIQTAGGSAALDPAVGGLLAVPDLDSLGNAYDQLGPQIYLANGVATLFSALDFTDELMSCETRDKGNVFIAQDQCVWARVSGNWLDQDDTSQTIGFDRWAARFSGGVQAQLAPDWRLGLALGYEHGDLNALGGLQNSTSDSVYGGAAIKYTKGNGLLAAAVSGGHGWYDTTRNLAFGGFGGQASASHDVSHINARLRGAWAFTRDNRYIKPMVDLNLSWIDMGGFTESGGPGLSVAGSQETVWSVTPAVEFGWQRALGDGRLIRPYVRAGVTLLDDPSFATVSSFTAAPAGTAGFQATMSTDDVIGEIAAGMDVLMTNGAVVKVFYEGRFGETTIQQSGGLKASMKF